MLLRSTMKIGIIGAGKIGTSVATLLETCGFCREVVLGDNRDDVDLTKLKKARAARLDASKADQSRDFVRHCEAIVSAAPFYLNRGIAQACAEARVPYFDLTEDVATTGYIRTLAAGSEVTFMPQCGLAPGAVNIIGGSLAGSLENVRQCELRVGALPLNAGNQMKYYLSWSTAGLINEYCRIGEALHEGKRIPTVPLDGVERLTIDGTEYEAFNTSGGVATMCETFCGRVAELNYKTVRYPGHRDLIKFVLQDLNLAKNQELLTQIFDQEVPLTDSDIVIFYVNVIGYERKRLVQRSFVKKIQGRTVEGQMLNAIQLATSAGMVAALELHARGALGPGFIRQESIAMDEFLSTQWGRIYLPPRGP